MKRSEAVARRFFVKKVFLDISQKFIGKHRYQSLFLIKLRRSEAVARRCSVKKVFLEISQNLQENTGIRDTGKRDSGTGVFL